MGLRDLDCLYALTTNPTIPDTFGVRSSSVDGYLLTEGAVGEKNR
jgi:hypothetical protein